MSDFGAYKWWFLLAFVTSFAYIFLTTMSLAREREKRRKQLTKVADKEIPLPSSHQIARDTVDVHENNPLMVAASTVCIFSLILFVVSWI